MVLGLYCNQGEMPVQQVVDDNATADEFEPKLLRRIQGK